MKSTIIHVIMLAGLMLVGVGCQTRSPILEQPYSVAAATAALEPVAHASPRASFRLGAGDVLGEAVYRNYVTLVRHDRPLPPHLQFAEASEPYVLRSAIRPGLMVEVAEMDDVSIW